jgi:hypothetical protein
MGLSACLDRCGKCENSTERKYSEDNIKFLDLKTGDTYTGRVFYRFPEHDRCHRICQWMQSFCTIELRARGNDKRNTV